MEPPSFSTTGPHIIRAAPGSDASLVLPLPSGSPPFQFEWSRAGAKLDDRFKRSDDASGVRLTISAARTGDSGVYTLQASNAAGKDTTRVRLEVSPDEIPTGDDPPNFLRRLQDLTVKVGTRTRFLVEIVSSTECRVTWYRNERRLLEAERIALVRDGNFWCADISAVSVDDAGRWTCTAENVGGRASCSAHLNVLVPKAYKRPEFVEELRALLTEQGTVSLECKVVGVPTPVLRWFKDSREIKAGDVFALTANAEDPTSLGTYTCEAINCMGRAYSSSKVHVVGRVSREGSSRPSSGGFTPEPPPIFTKELEDQLARICEPITLSCNIVVPPWPRSVVWYNKEGKIEPSEKYHVLEDGVGGYLLEVPSAEWPDEGEWKCVATSTGGRVGISTCYVSMDVPKNYRKPRFMENLQAVLTEEGLVSFECKVVGFPTPVLSWFKDGQELKPGDVYQLTGTNSLGSYCCIAKNCMGQASSSAELTVEDIQNQLNEEEKLQLFSKNQAPKFLQGLKSAEAKIDEPFRFTIKVSIPPEPVVSWYRDDQPVDESSRCHHGKEDRGVFFLDIQNLEFMDQAEWKCVAMNDFGQSVTSCFLKLLIPRHYKKPRFLENLQAILSDEGAVNLECKVIGVPQPVLKWYKDGEELKPGDIHRIISGQDGTCCLGTYTCEAQNCMGIAASSASLLGFEDSMKAKNKKKAEEQALQRNLSLSTIHEERTSQMYDTPVGDITLDEKGEISFSFDGKEVSVSLYETPDLTEEEALQIVEMYADQLSENVTEHNVVELPPLRFVKETSTSGNLLMEAIIIDVSPEYFTSPEEDLRTEADIEDISIADENGPPQLSLDIEADGDDYLEKTIALLSDEKIEFPKKSDRKKSDSQKSVDDYFSLSRDQSLSEEKKDDDTQILSESDVQSFASARSSGKPKSKSSKPSIDDGQESSEITKTVLLKEDLQNLPLETDLSFTKQQRHDSQRSRRSSSESEKAINKAKEQCEEFKTEPESVSKNIDIDKTNVNTIMNSISSTLTEVINEIQIIERDLILKSEFMSTTATASSSLEIINSLITPLSEIHSITDAIRESFDETKESVIPLLNKLPQSLNNLQQSLTIMCKCIDAESENKTLVKKTSISIIQKCGVQLQSIIKEINTAVHRECLVVEKKIDSNIESISMELINLLNNTIDMVNSEENRKIEKEDDAQEDTLESKHLQNTQKAIHELKASLKSLLLIIEEEDITKLTSFVSVKNSEIILSNMSTPIQDLQNALEQIEILSVAETKTNLHKYNTEIIETAMESVLKLRSSFEELSAEASSIEDDNALTEILNAIKFNIKDISITLDGMETKIGKFDILSSDNKMYALQKMAQILINLENNLSALENLPVMKENMSQFHKNLTKVLENVIESNDASKYFSLLEICDGVNRVNTLIKSIDSNNVLALASICNTLKIIKTNIINNLFQPELNHSIISNITNTLISVLETINNADVLKIDENSDKVESFSLKNYEENNVKVAIENIEKTIISISNVISHETTMDMSLKNTMENICPILEDLKCYIASVNVNETDKHDKTSDIESLSVTESIANPILELNKTINVLNQVICENIECQERKQLMEQYAKPLLELRNTLEILQHDAISQYIENSTHLDMSSSIANVVESLQSCLVMIQEQNVIEAVDDMSTLEDISVIKTIADILPSDDFQKATVAEMPIIQQPAAHQEQTMQSDAIQVLQILNEDINNLKSPELLSTLDTDVIAEYSYIKSVIVGLEETHSHIKSILQQISLETCEEHVPIDRLEQVLRPLQEVQQQLSVINVSNITVYENKLDGSSDKDISLSENLLEFKSHLNECLNVLLPALATTDNTIDISIKIKHLQETCQKIDLEAVFSDKELNGAIIQLRDTVKPFLDATDFCENGAEVKCAVENLYENIVAVKEELSQYMSKEPDVLSRDDDILKALNDIENCIISLEKSNFVNLSQFNISKQNVVEIKEQGLFDKCINNEDILKTYLSIIVDPIEVIYNEIINLNQMSLSASEALYEKNIEATQIKLKQAELHLSNVNKNIMTLEKRFSIENVENSDVISLATKLDNNIQYILKQINAMELGRISATITALRQSMKVVDDILHHILPSGKVYVEEQKYQEQTEALLQHMEHYIEVIETVEEVSAVIKLDDLKESANIVRELKQSIVSQESVIEKTEEGSLDPIIREEQAEIAQRLQKALISLQNQALENPQEVISTTAEDVRQQIVEVVSDLQNDLIALTGTHISLEENLALAVPLSLKENSQTIQDTVHEELLEKDQIDIDNSKLEDILAETTPTIRSDDIIHIKSDDQNEQQPNKEIIVDCPSENSMQLNEEHIKNQDLELKPKLSKYNEQSAGNDRLKISEMAQKSEKVAEIQDNLIGNLMEYISENTMAVNAKLSNPLHSEHLEKSIQIAKQLLATTVNKNSDQAELLNFSTDQIELVLNLKEAILIMYETTFEESQELEMKVGKEEMQTFKNVVNNLSNILESVINTFEALSPFNQAKQQEGEESNIKDSVQNIIPAVAAKASKSISISNDAQEIIETKCNIADRIMLSEVTENLDNVDLLKTEDFSDKSLIKIVTDKQKENIPLSSETIIKDNVTGLAVEEIKMKTSIKDELIKYIGNFISEDTEKMQGKLPLLFDSESARESLKMAHKLYDMLSVEEAKTFILSKEELKLALLLEKSLSSLYESTANKDQDTNINFEGCQPMRASIVTKDLCITLHTIIELNLTQANLEILDLDEVTVLVSLEPFKYELIEKENISEVVSLITKTAPEQVLHQDLKLAVLNETEKSDDLTSDTISLLDSKENPIEVYVESDENKSTITAKNMEVLSCSPAIQENLETSGFNDDKNSIYKLENLLKEVIEMIDISCDENMESIQNTLDEVQTVIIKLKSDLDGSMSDTCNETLEDLECNVRSVQLQINEQSPQHLLKEACSNLQVLVAYIKEKSDVAKMIKHRTQITNSILSECSKNVAQTITLIEKVTCSKNTNQLGNIVSNLNKIKNTMKSLKGDFLADAETLIASGVDLIQSLDQVEEMIFSIEKDLDLEQKVDPITKDSIISAIHSVYESISNMRGTISSVQKRYLNENYGEPSRSFLQSIRNVMIVSKKDENSSWKQFAKCLRKVLNHFEDVKFYINFDKTARLPSDAAFTKIILGELYAILSTDIQKSIKCLDAVVSQHLHNSMKYIDKKLNDLEQRTTVEVREKIPIFNDLSKSMLELTELIEKHFEMNMENYKLKNEGDSSGIEIVLESPTTGKEEMFENIESGKLEKEYVDSEYVQVINQPLPHGDDIFEKNECFKTNKKSDESNLINIKEPLQELSENELKNCGLKKEDSRSDLAVAIEQPQVHEEEISQKDFETTEIIKKDSQSDLVNEIGSPSNRQEVIYEPEVNENFVTTQGNAFNLINIIGQESVHPEEMFQNEMERSEIKTEEDNSKPINAIQPSSTQKGEISETEFESIIKEEKGTILISVIEPTSVHDQNISEEVKIAETKMDEELSIEIVSQLNLNNGTDVTLVRSDEIPITENENILVINEKDHLNSINKTEHLSVQEREISKKEVKTTETTEEKDHTESVKETETSINKAEIFETGDKSSITKNESVGSDCINEIETTLVHAKEISIKEAEKSETKEEENRSEQKEYADLVIAKDPTSGFVAEISEKVFDSNEIISFESAVDIMTVSVQKKEDMSKEIVNDESILEKGADSNKIKTETLSLDTTKKEAEESATKEEENRSEQKEYTDFVKTKDPTAGFLAEISEKVFDSNEIESSESAIDIMTISVQKKEDMSKKFVDDESILEKGADSNKIKVETLSVDATKKEAEKSETKEEENRSEQKEYTDFVIAKDPTPGFVAEISEKVFDSNEIESSESAIDIMTISVQKKEDMSKKFVDDESILEKGADSNKIKEETLSVDATKKEAEKSETKEEENRLEQREYTDFVIAKDPTPGFVAEISEKVFDSNEIKSSESTIDILTVSVQKKEDMSKEFVDDESIMEKGADSSKIKTETLSLDVTKKEAEKSETKEEENCSEHKEYTDFVITKHPTPGFVAEISEKVFDNNEIKSSESAIDIMTVSVQNKEVMSKEFVDDEAILEKGDDSNKIKTETLGLDATKKIAIKEAEINEIHEEENRPEPKEYTDFVISKDQTPGFIPEISEKVLDNSEIKKSESTIDIITVLVQKEDISKELVDNELTLEKGVESTKIKTQTLILDATKEIDAELVHREEQCLHIVEASESKKEEVHNDIVSCSTYGSETLNKQVGSISQETSDVEKLSSIEFAEILKNHNECLQDEIESPKIEAIEKDKFVLEQSRQETKYNIDSNIQSKNIEDRELLPCLNTTLEEDNKAITQIPIEKVVHYQETIMKQNVEQDNNDNILKIGDSKTFDEQQEKKNIENINDTSIVPQNTEIASIDDKNELENKKEKQNDEGSRIKDLVKSQSDVVVEPIEDSRDNKIKYNEAALLTATNKEETMNVKTIDESHQMPEKIDETEIIIKTSIKDHVKDDQKLEEISVQGDEVCNEHVIQKYQESSIENFPQTDGKLIEYKQNVCKNEDDITKIIDVNIPVGVNEEPEIFVTDDKPKIIEKNKIEPNNNVSSSEMDGDDIKAKVSEGEETQLEIIQSEFVDKKYVEKDTNKIASRPENKENPQIRTEEIETKNKRNEKKKNKTEQKDVSLLEKEKLTSQQVGEKQNTINEKDKINEQILKEVKQKTNLETVTSIEEMDEEIAPLSISIERKENALLNKEQELLNIACIKEDKIESHTLSLLEEIKSNINEDKNVKAGITKAIDEKTDNTLLTLVKDNCQELDFDVVSKKENTNTNDRILTDNQQQDQCKMNKELSEAQETQLTNEQKQENQKTVVEKYESGSEFLEDNSTSPNIYNASEIQELSIKQLEDKRRIEKDNNENENNESVIKPDGNNKESLTEADTEKTLKRNENGEDRNIDKLQQKEKKIVKSSRKKSKQKVIDIKEKNKLEELKSEELEDINKTEKNAMQTDQNSQKTDQTEDTQKILSNKVEVKMDSKDKQQIYESGIKIPSYVEDTEKQVSSNIKEIYQVSEIDAKQKKIKSVTKEENKMEEKRQLEDIPKSKVEDDIDKKVGIALEIKNEVKNRDSEEDVLTNKNYILGSLENKYNSNIINDEHQINEHVKRRCPIVVDHNFSDYVSEFSRPPGYIAKTFDDESTPQFQISAKNPTIYKSQTLLYESQLRSSLPPHIQQRSDTIEERYQILNDRTKDVSECRSTLSEKRTGVARDVKRKPVFTTYLTDRTAVESSRVKLTCSILSPTNTTVIWSKNGIVLDNKHKFRTKCVDGLITLEIFNAVPTDSGEYSCTIENENGSITTSATLKVYPSFEASPIPPTFTRSIRDNYHLAENELVLECRIRGQPLPSITWFKDGRPITLNDHYEAHYLADGVCRLTISSPSAEDSGKYVCKAENSVWSDQISHDVYFTGKEGRLSPNIATLDKMHFSRHSQEARRPHFTNVLSDHKVVTGGTIGLQVEIKGSPTRVEWLREGHAITEIYRNAQTYVDHGIYTLALSNVTEKESGLYTCRAYSTQGNVDMNASITVVQSNQYEGKPASIVSRPEKDLIIPVGEDLNITFRVQGEPKPKVFFMKGIRDITNSQRVCKMTSDDYVKFTLKRTVVSDAGTYCIFARNAYGCDRSFVTVVIRQRASSESLISDWTYTMDDLAISAVDRNYKSVPDRIPSEPSAVDGGNNWISLGWPKPNSQERAPILAYKVESWLLGKEGGARWVELGITPRNSFDVFNLKQGEEYHFRVTPRNRYGWGESIQTSIPIGIGLAGDRPEFIEILPGQLKVLVDETAILSCSFKGKPTPEIVWMKNGHEIEEEAERLKIDQNGFNTSLRINRVTIEDEGRYSCEATNIHGRSSTYARMAVITDRQIWEADAKLKRERSAGIDGEYPPQFTMRLRDRRVQATYPVRLTCQVVGNPTPIIKWFKNGEEVLTDGRHTASQDEYFYTLEIAPTKLEDGGVYEAMARNGCGAVSCRCSLVVDKGIRAYIAPEFCCGLEPLYRLSEGEELRISAIVEAYPSVGVTWYRDGVRLRPSRKTIMTLDRDGQIELALASVTGRDGGVYTCTASNEVGRASTSGKVEIVSGEHVMQKTSAPPIVICSDVPYSREPMFIKKPRSSEAREGDTVIIECEVIGDPKPDVYWLRDFLKPDYYRDSSHFKRVGAGPAYRFEIPHAKLDYTGAYSIVAKNIHGETKAIISLQILAKDLTCGDDVHNIRFGRVEVIPRFDKELTDLLCYDGDAIEFECRVSGNPEPDIRWFHYNEIVPECPDFETCYEEGTARLKIKQVTAEDEGSYTCEASNCLGKATSSSCLVVYPPGEPNTLSQRLRRPPAFLSAASTPRSTPRTTPARSLSRTPGPESRRLCSPSREIAPKFYTYPYNKVAEEGDTIVFQCAVKGLPPPWATWDKDGIIITPSARISIKEKDEMFRILEIEQVTIEDVGLYRITLENDYGRAEASARLEVITQKGKFYGSARSYSVSPRKTLTYRRRTPSFSKD